MFPKLPKKKHKYLDSKPASETLKELGEKRKNGKTKISEIMEDFHENGLLLALVFFALPVAIPLPYPPGFTTIMGVPLVVLSVQMILGSKRVKLPKKINEYAIKNSILKKISDKIVPIVEGVEKYVKPRYKFARSVYCEQLVGIVSFIAAVAVTIPLPMTNAIPALGITVMALGLLNRDGLVIIGGIVVAILGTVIAVSAILASWLAIKYVIQMLFNLFF